MAEYPSVKRSRREVLQSLAGGLGRAALGSLLGRSAPAAASAGKPFRGRRSHPAPSGSSTCSWRGHLAGRSVRSEAQVLQEAPRTALPGSEFSRNATSSAFIKDRPACSRLRTEFEQCGQSGSVGVGAAPGVQGDRRRRHCIVQSMQWRAALPATLRRAAPAPSPGSTRYVSSELTARLARLRASEVRPTICPASMVVSETRALWPERVQGLPPGARASRRACTKPSSSAAAGDAVLYPHRIRWVGLGRRRETWSRARTSQG